MTSTSPGSARSGTAPITKPSSSSAGRSFAECTARSTSPASSASRIVSIHRPLSPCGEASAAAPFVAGGAHRHDLGLDARARRAAQATSSAWARARAERRVPMRRVVTPPRGRSRAARPARRACTPSVPGSDRSFSSTIGSCRSFATMPRASASTASRSSGVSSARREAQPVELGPHHVLAAARGARGSAARARRRAGAPRSGAPPRRRARARARCRRPSPASCAASRSRSDTMSITPHAVDVRGLGLHVAGHREVEEHERAVRRARPSRRATASAVHHDARRAGRAHDEVGVRERVGERVEVAVLGVRALGERPRVLERAVQDPDRPDAAVPEVLHGERGHLTGAHDDHVAALEPAERLVGEVGAERHERVGRGAERRLLAHAPAGARGRVEQPGQRGPGGVLGLGAPERLAHLRVDLRLAEHHRVEPARRRRTGDRRRRAPSGSTAARPAPRAPTPRVSASRRFRARNPAW